MSNYLLSQFVMISLNKYRKSKMRTYGDKVYTDFHDLGSQEDGVEFGCMLISIDSLFIRKNITHKFIQMIVLKIFLDKQVMIILSIILMNLMKNSLWLLILTNLVVIINPLLLDLTKNKECKECIVFHYWYFN